MENEEKGKGGRPSTGREYPHKVFGYFDDEGLQKLRALARIYGGNASAIRRAVDKLAEAEGVE